MPPGVAMIHAHTILVNHGLHRRLALRSLVEVSPFVDMLGHFIFCAKRSLNDLFYTKSADESDTTALTDCHQGTPESRYATSWR